MTFIRLYAILNALGCASAVGAPPPDARFELKAGLHDDGVAAWNIQLVSSRPTPPGFFDPANPGGLPMNPDGSISPLDDQGVARWQDPPNIAFATSDLAFSGDRVFVGGYHGV